MRSTHIAWIGGVLTFAVVVSVGLWRQDPGSAPSAVTATPVMQERSARMQAGQPSEAPQAATATVESYAVPQTGDPPEDGRAMMDAAAADPDPAVRDEAAALSRALETEAASGTQ